MMGVLKSTFATELQAILVPFFKEHHFNMKEHLTDKTLLTWVFGRCLFKMNEVSLSLQKQQQCLLLMIKLEILRGN